MIKINHETPCLNKNTYLQALISQVLAIFGIGALNVGAFAHTIGARNICLGFGAFCSLILLSIIRKNLLQTRFFCSYLLLGIVAWMALHYLVFPIASAIAFKELTSTWLRIFLAIILGAGLGLTISRNKTLKNIVLLSFLFLLLLQLLLYGLKIYQLGHLPTSDFNGIFISKAGGTYFLMWSFLIICAYIDFLVHCPSNTKTRYQYFFQLFLSAFVLACCIGAFYTLRSLNGLLVASICIFVLIVRIFLALVSQRRFLKSGLAFIAVIAVLSLVALHSYSKQDGGKLSNLLTDAHIGTQVDLYTHWRNYPGTQWSPTLSDGHNVNQSTYYRIANAIEGTRIIKDNPLGAGFTYLPYGYYLSRLYPGSQSDHTHSGWIDFTLGVGIPGLVLCWGAIALAISLGLSQIRKRSSLNLPPTLWPYITVWALSGMTLLWVVLEVSEKEYLEHLFLMIAFLAAGNAPLSNSPPPKAS